MKDDIFKKLQTLLSGSTKLATAIDPKEKNEEDIDLKEKNEELVSNFMNQILDSTWVEEELKNTCIQNYFLSKKEKSYWLLNTQSKVLMNIKGGVEIIPVEIGLKDSVCVIGYNLFKIPNELMICAGWN